MGEVNFCRPLFGRANRDEDPATVSRCACHVAPAVCVVHRFPPALGTGCECRLAIGNGQLKLCAGCRLSDPLVYDLDWNEDKCLVERRAARPSRSLPVLQAIRCLEPARRPAARALTRRAAGSFSSSPRPHLASFYFGLKSLPVDRRRHRDHETRLLARSLAGLPRSG
ncbi:DUF1612 domain-containing protein [Rhizobium ruizarguesonis]|nr:DUF1612 domain-containing protein [Rhizobium ruizarguesonis]